MANTGRNDPCPCGSGRKYKRCCLPGVGAAVEKAVVRDPGPLLDDKLTLDLLEYAEDNLHAGYEPEKVFKREGRGKPEDGLFFIPWSLYHHPVDGKTVVEWFLADRGAYLGRAKRAWLEAQRRALLSYWEVAEVEPGVGLVLQCLFTGVEHRVREQTGSRLLQKWHVLLARVVEYDGKAYVVGCHDRALPPGLGAQATGRVREELKIQKGPVPEDQVRAPGTALLLVREWYAGVKAQDAEPVVTGLTNTDGHDLVFVTDRHSFDPARREEVVAALRAMKGAEADPESEGTIKITFTRAGNRRNKGWTNTIVGSGTIGADTLILETNSSTRGAALLRRVRKACPDLLTRLSQDYRSAEHLLRQRVKHPRGADEAPPMAHEPEVLEMLRKFKERTSRGWMDVMVPALGGLTPRAAARSAKWRPTLEVLVKEMEQAEERCPAGERIDLSFLRGELRLTASRPTSTRRSGSRTASGSRPRRR